MPNFGLNKLTELPNFFVGDVNKLQSLVSVKLVFPGTQQRACEYRVCRQAHLKDVFMDATVAASCESTEYVFLLDGQRIGDEDSIASLGIDEDDVVVDAVVHQQGGGGEWRDFLLWHAGSLLRGASVIIGAIIISNSIARAGNNVLQASENLDHTFTQMWSSWSQGFKRKPLPHPAVPSKHGRQYGK